VDVVAKCGCGGAFTIWILAGQRSQKKMRRGQEATNGI